MPNHRSRQPDSPGRQPLQPWRDSTNEERLNCENGLLLTPSLDHLFHRGFIGFEDPGRLVISPVAHLPSLERMGFETRGVVNVGGFSDGQRRYLGFHRSTVKLRAVRKAGAQIRVLATARGAMRSESKQEKHATERGAPMPGCSGAGPVF